MGSQSTIATPKSLALMSQGLNPSSKDDRMRKGRPWCDHCHKPGCAKDTFWKIHGKLADWKPSRPPPEWDNRGLVATGNEHPNSEITLFNKEQMDLFQKLLTQLQP